MFYREHVVASLHIYPGYDEAILRLYSGDEGIDEYVARTITRVLRELLPWIRVKKEVLKRPRIL